MDPSTYAPRWLLTVPLLSTLLMAGGGSKGIASETFTTADGELHGEILQQDLNHPWAIAFLPDGSALISERPGRLLRFRDAHRSGAQGVPVSGLPEDLVAQGQGGLMDLALHPDFEDNRYLYFTYSAAVEEGLSTRLSRARLHENELRDMETLFTAEPGMPGGQHFGSRIVFDAEGYVYIGVGDRGRRDHAQDTSNHIGTIIRLYDDGRVPDDNPLTGDAEARPEIWAWGIRNPQGMVIDPATGTFWQHEHGPRGGDEINIIEPGRNYGWPVITHGREYSGGPVGEGIAEKDGMESPLHHWTPSIAPSGLAILRDAAFPDWEGELLVGGLVKPTLQRLRFENREPVHEVEVMPEVQRRIRDVRVHAGALWVLTDHNPGELIRLSPAP